jgi:hypothetical protein
LDEAGAFFLGEGASTNTSTPGVRGVTLARSRARRYGYASYPVPPMEKLAHANKAANWLRRPAAATRNATSDVGARGFNTPYQS